MGYEGKGTKLAALGVGGFGLTLALALEADVGLSSGIWYPVVYAGLPAIAAAGMFADGRPTAGPLELLCVCGWFLASSVLALAVAVVLAAGAAPELTQSPVTAVLSAGVLYLGFLLVPLALSATATRYRGALTALLLALSPVGQVAIAAMLLLS